LLTAGVGWSRLVLERHTRVEVAVGTVVGVMAGAAFQVAL
jgi:membrane-associated phospholipid phosphatase